MTKHNCTIKITRPTGQQVRNEEYSERDWIYTVERKSTRSTVTGVAYSKQSAIAAANKGIERLND